MIHPKDSVDDLINSFESLIRFEAKEYGDFLSDKPSRATTQREVDSLAGIAREIEECIKCPLSNTRSHVVPGEGNPQADLVFVGEAPGFDEDKEGRPFVGKAGQLLTKIIEAMRFKREDVFICNILKCRPPHNRNPEDSEIHACRSYLDRQLTLIKPRVICTLGKFASQTLLDTQTPISRLRGKFYDYKGIKVMPTFHPAYLLRNPNDKRLVWEDMQEVMSQMK